MDRVLPLNSKACEAIRVFLNIRPELKVDNLFLIRQEQVLGDKGVQKVLDKYMDNARITGASVHSLRHTYAAHHVARGTSLKTIQEVMGHQDIRTTEVYVSLAREMQRKELQEHAL